MTHGHEQAPAVCLDVGSTWTKAALVHGDGTLAGFAEHATTPADVLAGMDAAVRAVTAAGPPGQPVEPELLACSSAGGGLRLAVVGNDRLISTEAGHRVASSAGARVVHVHAGPLEPADIRLLRSTRPGVVLLMGGADDDDPGPLVHNANRLAGARVRYPIVLAGTTAGRDHAQSLLRSTGRTVMACGNVAPRPGAVVPEPARAAVARLYLRQVIGGRGGGRGAATAAPRFRRIVRIATPDAVRGGAAELARMCDAGVLVVDVGAATTDVCSARGGDPQPCRTVEGDLGMRSGVAGVLIEGQTEGVVDPVEADLLGPTVARVADDVGYVPRDAGSAAEDRRLAAVAALVAVRRHVRLASDPGGGGLDVGLVVLTGGVFRQRDTGGLGAVVATLRGDSELRRVLADAPMFVDADCVMAPAGLLAAGGRPAAAEALLRDHLLG